MGLPHFRGVNVMRHIIFTVCLLLSITSSIATAEDNKSAKNLQLQLKANEDKLRQLENQNNEIKNDLINRTIGMYEVTNDRLNTHISYISLIATIFGLIIAIGGVWIGYESIRSRKRTEEAIRTLEEAKKYVEDKKEDFDAIVNRRLKDIDEEFQRVVGLLKEQLVADVNNATQEVKTIAETKTQEIQGYSIERKSEEALETLNRRIAFFENIGIPDDPKILLLKAKLLDEKKMYDEAIELLEKLVKLDPKNGKGYWQLGWEFGKKEEYEKSIDNYKKCIEFEPNNASAYNNMGVALDRLDKYDEALKAYEMALSKKNDMSLYHSNKASILNKLKKYDDAIATYKNAITLLPNEETLYTGLLNILKKSEYFDDMLEYYDLAIKNITEKSQDYNFDKASLLAQMDKADEAVQILTNLAEQNYKTSDCYLKIADIRFKQGKRMDGIAVLDKAISMDPKNGELYLKKAELLVEDKIEQAYETIIGGLSHVKGAYYLQKGARIIAGKGEKNKARKLYQMAGDICKAEFLKKEKEADLMNYYESLLITEEYDEAENILNKHKGIIKSAKYQLVVRVLKLYEKIIQKQSVNFDEELRYYKEAIILDGIGWIFDDILNFLRLDADEKSYKFVSAIIQLVKKEIDKDEFTKIVG